MFAKKIIRKHVIIIHAYSLMSVLQRKIVNALLFEALNSNRQNDLDDQDSVVVECQIPLLSLRKAINYNSNNKQHLIEAIDGLASLKIEWNLLKDKTPTNISFLNLRILHGSPTFYLNNTLNFSFHKVLLDLVTNPSIYGTIDLDLQTQFESKYSHALYENSTRFINLQKNKIIELETFRKILGVQQSKYNHIRELTRNVISPAIEEVNDRANFVINLETIKNGRKTLGYEISVKNKDKSYIPDNLAAPNEKEAVYKNIKEFFGNINESVLHNILNSYPDQYIFEKIAYTKKCKKPDNSGFYPIPYFISALKQDYKFKEENPPKINNHKSIDANVEWEEKLIRLQGDLRHFKNQLDWPNADDNLIKIRRGIVTTCEEDIKKHYLERPNKEREI